MRDGTLIPHDPYKAYAEGAAREIDLMTGTNKDEARYWIYSLGGMIPYTLGVNIWPESIYKNLPDSEKSYVYDFYGLLDEKLVWKRTEFLNELFFRVPAVTVADGHATSGGNTYVYFWTQPEPGKENSIEGACHTAELPYVFGNFVNGHTPTPAELMLSEKTMGMWTEFAKTGCPSPQWAKYDTLRRASMVIGDSIYVEDDVLGQQRRLISPLMHHYISPLFHSLDLGVPFVYTCAALIAGAILIVVVGIIVLRKRRRKRR